MRAARAAVQVTELTQAQIDSLSAAWLTHLLEEDEEERLDWSGFCPAGRSRAKNKLQETNDIVGAGTADALSVYDTRLIAFEVQDFAASHGFHLDPTSRAFQRLAVAFLKASARANEMAQQRQQGTPVDTPAAPVITSPVAASGAAGAITLEDLLDYFAARKKPAQATLSKYRGIFSEFARFHGSSNVVTMRKADFVAFVDDQLGKGAHPRTVDGKISALKSVFSLAVRNDKLSASPLATVFVDQPSNQEKPVVEFEAEDLQQLFSSAVFTEGQRPGKLKGEASYWLPVIALYTGARLEEIGQLRVEDLKRDKAAGLYFDITNIDGRSTKNPGAVRKVPVHPKLVALGLLQYVESVRSQGGQLFPLLKANKKGKHTATFSTGFGEFLRGKVKLLDTRKVFHSLRHTFKTATRAARIPIEIHDAITGHAPKGEGAKYGSTPLSVLADEMVRVKYPGLRIPKWRPGAMKPKRKGQAHPRQGVSL